MSAPVQDAGQMSVPAVARRLGSADPGAWAIAFALWVGFYLMPLPLGWVVARALDRVAEGSTGGVWALLAVFIGLELGRWTLLVAAAVQWHGAWLGWLTLPRVNMLRSAAIDPGPADQKLPGSPGEAVSRFRDDTQDLSSVLDVWLDVAGALLSAAIAFGVLFLIHPVAAVAVLTPTALALGIARVLGPRLRVWRRTHRAATARVTGFIGDTFAGVLAVKTNAAEPAIDDRFRMLNDDRAEHALRDHLGSEAVRSLGYGTGEITVGVALLAAAGAFAAGDLSVGEITLFAAYVPIIAGVAKWAARVTIYHRQADVSVDRMAELVTGQSRADVVAPAPTHLRSGPPPLVSTTGSPLPPLEILEVERVEVRRGGLQVLGGVRFQIRRGDFVVITGEVGSGKTTLLRALLGLTTVDTGSIRWNGSEVGDPSTAMVPPRVAYVPQVPRLFSETFGETVLLGHPCDALDRSITAACLDEDLERMPAGLGTLVGPRGIRLSGGQVQRTAAARALVRHADLLVVDDMSSALDVVTERRVWDQVFDHGYRTALVVSHRPAVLERADRVITLIDGQVAEHR